MILEYSEYNVLMASPQDYYSVGVFAMSVVESCDRNAVSTWIPWKNVSTNVPRSFPALCIPASRPGFVAASPAVVWPSVLPIPRALRNVLVKPHGPVVPAVPWHTRCGRESCIPRLLPWDAYRHKCCMKLNLRGMGKQKEERQ